MRIGITIGDFNGVGPELIIEAFSRPGVREICTPVIYGAPRIFNVYRKLMSVDKFSYNVIQTPDQAQPRRISVIDCIDVKGRVEPGRPDQDSGMAAFQALEAATKDLKAGLIDALVTMPSTSIISRMRTSAFPAILSIWRKHLR